MNRDAMTSTRPASSDESSSLRLTWGLLAVLVVLRGVAPLLPGSWFWGVDPLQDLPTWVWFLWILTALSLVPFLAGSLTPYFDRLAQAVESGGLRLLPILMAAGVLVFLFPDRIRFVGDFLMRQGTAEVNVAPSRLFPQALPLDVFIHHLVPSWVHENLDLRPNLTNRFLGAVNAVILAWLAFVFAARLGVRGAALLATAAMVWFGGWLGLFTGFAKAFAELTWVFLAIAILGLDVLRGRRPFFLLALLVCLSLWIHRSALGFLPAFFLLGTMVSWKKKSEPIPDTRRERRKKAATNGSREGHSLWGVLAGGVAVLGTLALIFPRLQASYQALDATHFSTQKGIVGVFATVFSPLRLLDDLNMILLLVPLAPLAVLAFWHRRLQVVTSRERNYLLALCLPYFGLLLALTPAQGLYRDYDTFAVSGMAIAILVAVGVAETLRRSSQTNWLASSVMLGAMIPAFLWMLLASDLDRGLKRVEAWVNGPPLRSEAVQAKTWDYLGVANYRAGRYQESVRCFERAVELGPSPRVVLQWATAAELARDRESARRAFELLLQRAPEVFQFRFAALVGLARIAQDEEDWDTMRKYVVLVQEMAPDNSLVMELAAELEAQSGLPHGSGR